MRKRAETLERKACLSSLTREMTPSKVALADATMWLWDLSDRLFRQGVDENISNTNDFDSFLYFVLL